MNSKTRHLSIALISLGLAAGSALAGSAGARSGHAGQPGQPDQFDFARVTQVQPIFETVQIPTSEQVCWDEPVNYRAGGPNPVGTIGGAIVGGVIGNQFGGGNGRRAMTVAGVLLGAAVGNEVSRQPRRVYSGYEQRCEVRTAYTNEQRIVGYNVEYQYFGRRYYTQMGHDPGDRVRVRVSVTAVQ